MARERQLNLFHVDPDRPSFEDLANENGGKTEFAVGSKPLDALR
jgi:hypothetical protein